MPRLPGQPARSDRSDWATLRRLFPYLWHYKWRVIAALSFMVGAKVANVGVPLLLKRLVDAMTIKPGSAAALLVVPLGLLAGLRRCCACRPRSSTSCANWSSPRPPRARRARSRWRCSSTCMR